MFRHLMPQFIIIHSTFFVEAIVREDTTLGHRMFIINELSKKSAQSLDIQEAAKQRTTTHVAIKYL